MILRLSEKLPTKLKTGATSTLPLNENPLADWSASIFVWVSISTICCFQ